MIRGGIAAKIGDGYEGLWTAQRLLDVLLARASLLRTEPVDEDSAGFEFWIEHEGTQEWHQCKRRSGSGSTWTIKALAREGVLADFQRKLVAGSNICVFVSSDPAPDFKSMCDKARLFDNSEAFAASLSQDECAASQIIRESWHAELGEQYGLLRRCSVEIVSDSFLQHDLERLCSVLFTNKPSLSVAALLAYVFDHLTQKITTEKVRSDLAMRGLVWRYADFDPSAERAMRDATDSYLRTFPGRGISGKILEMEESGAALEALTGPNAIKHVVVAGKAGGGKSQTMTALVQKLRATGVPVLAFRIDRFLESGSLVELGQQLLQRQESPVRILAGQSASGRCVLIVDQVDAISEVSGRSARARDLLFEMIAQGEFFPNVRVVLVCRSYDIENDSRLSAMAKSERTTLIRVEDLGWEEQVVPALRNLGLDPQRFSTRERAVLCVPLNLSLFADIVAGGQIPSGEISRSALIEQLIKLRDRELLELKLGWTAASSLSRLAEWMSRSQTLAVPASVLSDLPGCIDQLSSIGLIVSDRGQVQFAHESFFDYLFATWFLASSQSVRDFLLSGPQKLFRRTQVRQIFALLRESGVGSRYLQNLSEVMSSPDIRYLVKDAIGYWLSAVSAPTKFELDLVKTWFGKGNQLDNISRTVIAAPDWLEVVLRSGLIDRWLEGDEADARFGKWLLSRNAARNPDLVISTLKRWWQGQHNRTLELIDWCHWVDLDARVPVVEQFCLEVIAACPADAFEENNLPRRADISHWAHVDPESGARVLGAWFNRWFEVVAEGNPFTSNARSHDQEYWVTDIARKAPAAFLDNLFPLLVEAFRRESAEMSAQSRRYSQFSHRQPDEDNQPIHEFIQLFRQSLREVATTNPSRAEDLLKILPLNDGDAPLHLYLEAIAANGSSLAHLLPKVLDHPDLMEAGFAGAGWLSFAKAARESMPFLALSDRAHIECVTMSNSAELDYLSRRLSDDRNNIRGDVRTWDQSDRRHFLGYLSMSGTEEWAVLSTIGSELLSDGARKRLQELQRKFSGKALPEPGTIRSGFVGSPIKQTAIERMTDAQWLRAMERYSDERERGWLDDEFRGGSRQLSQMLQTQVKSDPARFAALLERMPRSLNANYVEGVLTGLREAKTETAVVVAAINSALEWQHDDLNQTICWLVREHPQAARAPKVLELMLRIARCGAASDNADVEKNVMDAETLNVSRLLDRGGGLHIRGINGDRGVAYEALSSVLWEIPETFSEITDLLQRRIPVEPLSSVRTCMMHTINSVSKYDVKSAIGLLLTLCAMDKLPFATHPGQHVMSWLAFNYPVEIEPIVSEMIASDAEHLRATGLLLLSGQALDDEIKEKQFLSYWAADTLSRRIAAFRAVGNLRSDRIGAKAGKWVLALLMDDCKEVRSEAANCPWKSILVQGGDHLEIAVEFVQSPAFEEDCDRFVMALEEHIDDFPSLAFDVICRIVELAKGYQPTQRNHHHLAIHNLGKSLVNLYRTLEADPEREASVLDLFDSYLALDLHGTREAVASYERG